MPQDSKEDLIDDSKKNTRRIGLNFTRERMFPMLFGLLFINYAFLMWFFAGYIYLPIIVAVWALLVIGTILVLNSLIIGYEGKLGKYLSVAGFFIAVYLMILVAGNYLPPYGTDELVTNTYAAYLFLHGKDPYIDSNMATEYAFYGYPQYLLTPLLRGGSVNYLIYPGLSVLLFVPAVLLGVRSYVVLVAFNVAAMFLIYYYYGKKNFLQHIPIVIIVMLINLEFMFFSLNGGDDIIWITFIGLSYVFRKKPYLAGIFYGLSIATKQIGGIILPFYLYFLYRENDRKFPAIYQFMALSIASFFVVNLPFIIMNPYQWLIHVLSIANQPIIGVGIGFSILSFAGFLNIPSILFAMYMVIALLVLLIIYLTYYDSLKYSFFAFPMIIFLFNYRALENYIVYWMYTIFLILPDLFAEYRNLAIHAPHIPEFKSFLTRARSTLASQKKVSWMLVAAIVIVGGVGSIGYGYSYNAQEHALNITGVYNASDPLWVNGNVTELTANVSYHPLSGDPSALPVQYRILTGTGATLQNLNGRLWYSSSPLLKPGNNTVNLFPEYSVDFLPSGASFKLEAYSGNFSAFSSLYKFSMNTTYPFQNPSMLYQSDSTPWVFPGWNLQSNASLPGKGYSYISRGINLSASYSGTTTSGMKYTALSSSVNFTRLALNNFTLAYNLDVWNGSAFSSTTVNATGIKTFIGVELSFNKGLESYWQGYSNNSSLRTFGQTEVVNLTSLTSLNFSVIMKLLKTYNWKYHDAVLTFMVGSYGSFGLSAASFSSVGLYNSAGQEVGIL
ncbi:MAG: hypothetical protein ACYDAZ_05005 [Thermoplasmataceae archaeon]